MSITLQVQHFNSNRSVSALGVTLEVTILPSKDSTKLSVNLHADLFKLEQKYHYLNQLRDVSLIILLTALSNVSLLLN